MQSNLWRLLGRQVDSSDADTRALLDDFARLSINSRINGPARCARPRIKRAGIIAFVVAVVTGFCLQQLHMPQQPLTSAPAILLGPHTGAASNCAEQVYITPGDPLQPFSATLSSAKAALPGAATARGPASAVQLSAKQLASTVQPAAETGAAPDFAKAGTETVAAASAESECPNIDTEAGTSSCPQARTFDDADAEAICLEPDQTATAAVDTNTAAMRSFEAAAAGTEAGTSNCSQATILEADSEGICLDSNQTATAALDTDTAAMLIYEAAAAGTADVAPVANLTILPISTSTPEPHLGFTPGMSAANMVQAVLTHAAVVHHRNPADDIAAAAIAFKPHCTWWLQGSLSASEAADVAAITGAGSPEFEDLFMQLAFIFTSKPTVAVAATAQFVETSASIVAPAFVATEQFVYSALRQTTR